MQQNIYKAVYLKSVFRESIYFTHVSAVIGYSFLVIAALFLY